MKLRVRINGAGHELEARTDESILDVVRVSYGTSDVSGSGKRTRSTSTPRSRAASSDSARFAPWPISVVAQRRT